MAQIHLITLLQIIVVALFLTYVVVTKTNITKRMKRVRRREETEYVKAFKVLTSNYMYYEYCRFFIIFALLVVSAFKIIEMSPIVILNGLIITVLTYPNIKIKNERVLDIFVRYVIRLKHKDKDEELFRLIDNIKVAVISSDNINSITVQTLIEDLIRFSDKNKHLLFNFYNDYMKHSITYAEVNYLKAYNTEMSNKFMSILKTVETSKSKEQILMIINTTLKTYQTDATHAQKGKNTVNNAVYSGTNFLTFMLFGMLLMTAVFSKIQFSII